VTLDPATRIAKLLEADAALSEAANACAGNPAEQYYLHGLWKARDILRALAAEQNAASASDAPRTFEDRFPTNREGDLLPHVQKEVAAFLEANGEELTTQIAIFKTERCTQLERELAAANILQKATHADFERASELLHEARSELAAAKKDVNDLNNLLREAGWGQGEIDSAAVLCEEMEAKIAAAYAELIQTPVSDTPMTDNKASEGLEYAISVLLDLKRRVPETLKICDIDSLIMNELNPALVSARKFWRRLQSLHRIVETQEACLAAMAARAVPEGMVKQWHDQLGDMIDQIGHPDYSLRELADGLRQIRDAMLSAHEQNAAAQGGQTSGRSDSQESPAGESASAVSEQAVALAAQVIAESPLIDAPKLPAACWHGLARSVLEAASAAPLFVIRNCQFITKVVPEVKT